MRKDELRIRPNKKGGFYLQRKMPFLLIFRRWKNVRECNTFGEALLFKDLSIPKEVFNPTQNPIIGTSGNIIRYELHKH